MSMNALGRSCERLNAALKWQRMDYEAAMAASAETVAVMRKHLLAMIQFLDLNYPRNCEMTTRDRDTANKVVDN